MLFKDLTGQNFGHLSVIRRGPNTVTKCAQFYCLCDCGVEKLIRSRSLISGKTISCGCQASIRTAMSNTIRKTKHGHKKNGQASYEYQIWRGIIDRATNPNYKQYHRYGGRGIKVCERWRLSFENFLADMGTRPSNKYSIDRENNDGDYEPSNCRWATQATQQNNRSTNVVIEYDGIKKTLSQWARHFGFKPHVIFLRIRNGWTFNKAITTPVKIKSK